MKAQSIFGSALLTAAMTLFMGCQKEVLSSNVTDADLASLSKPTGNKLQEHKLKGEYTAGSYDFYPDMAAGYVEGNPAPGWYPGTLTEGHLNMLGKSQGFVNMYASFGPNGLQGTPAPLNLYFASAIQDLGIVLPNNVAIIFYDKLGNSIWARGAGAEFIPIVPESPTRVTFSGHSEILGGTGKFANASGEFIISGFFNPQNTHEVGVTIEDGKIIY